MFHALNGNVWFGTGCKHQPNETRHSAVDRHPGGDREYYGLWYKDHLLGRPEPKPRFESAEDSIQKRKEFIRLCAVAFEAYDQKDALKTVVYGDSALRTRLR